MSKFITNQSLSNHTYGTSVAGGAQDQMIKLRRNQVAPLPLPGNASESSLSSTKFKFKEGGKENKMMIKLRKPSKEELKKFVSASTQRVEEKKPKINY